MKGPVGFSALGASTDHGTGPFCLSGESQSPKLPSFRPCPQTLFPSAASLVDEICSGLRLAYPVGDGSAAIRCRIDGGRRHRFLMSARAGYPRKRELTVDPRVSGNPPARRDGPVGRLACRRHLTEASLRCACSIIPAPPFPRHSRVSGNPRAIGASGFSVLLARQWRLKHTRPPGLGR